MTVRVPNGPIDRPVDHVGEGQRNPFTHVVRNVDERPLVGLCGTVAPASAEPYKGRLEQDPLPCVVCLDLKKAKR